MKKLLLLAFAASALAACSDDDKMPTPPQLETISFSEVELGAGGYLWGKTLATDVDGSLEFEGVIYKEGTASEDPTFLGFRRCLGHVVQIRDVCLS